jgi:serine protease Do
MMKRFPLMCFYLCVGFMGIYAQIRDFVCIVRPGYSTETKAFLEAASTKVGDAGYLDLSEYLKSGGSKTFGSGFVVSVSDGRIAVITNRHVVLDAETATLEFETSDGKRTEYKGCKIVAVDDELDLAIIELPKEYTGTKGLSLATTSVEDGIEVWSAGYPGLGNEPAWQLGKGNITNASARVTTLVDPAVTTLIQHSAPVDPGNSGGPLLVANKNRTGGYEVVGINTWKYFLRQAANFSIPAAKIRSFIVRGLGPESKESDITVLTPRVKNFGESIGINNPEDKNERIRKIARYLSLEYVQKTGADDVLKALASAPTAVRNEVLETLVKYSVIEGMRIASAWQIDKTLQTGGIIGSLSVSASGVTIADDGSSAVTYVAADGKTLSTVWKKNKVSWQIATTSVMELKTVAKETEKKKSSGGFDIEQPYDGALFFDYRPFDDGTIYGVSALRNFPFISYGVSAGTGMITVVSEDIFYTSKVEARAVELGGLARLQVPLKMGKACAMPFGEVRGGMRIVMDASGMDASGIYYGYGVGLQLMYGEELPIILTPGWSWLTTPDGSSYNAFTLSVGIGAWF